MKVCPSCQAEYIDVAVRCADCAVALILPGEAADALETRGRAAEADDEVEFDLSEWTAEERARLAARLQTDGVAHRWEAPFVDPRSLVPTAAGGVDRNLLVVPADDAETIDEILDEVEFPDALEPVTDVEADDEASYAVMSDLYVAADRLKRNPADSDAATDLVMAATNASSASVPYGVEIKLWEQVQVLAAGLAKALGEDADDSDVAADSARLRDMLTRYV